MCTRLSCHCELHESEHARTRTWHTPLSLQVAISHAEGSQSLPLLSGWHASQSSMAGYCTTDRVLLCALSGPLSSWVKNLNPALSWGAD